MALMHLQPSKSLERRLQASRQVGGYDIAKVISCQGRKEHQAHIGRRSAVGHDSTRCFLEMVWRKPVILRPNELLKKEPGAPRQPAQPFIVRGREGFSRKAEGTTDPIGDARRKK